MPAAILMSAEEQLLLELVNRARANPTAEASRYGVGLNEGLPAGTISTAPKQPLAPHPALMKAAGDHADDMLARDYFSHTNQSGQSPSDRVRAAGYPGNAGENISWGGSTQPINELAHVYERHRRLFLSPSHRANMLHANYEDAGLGVRYGEFKSEGRSFPYSSMVVENFGSAVGGQITGVAFSDLVTNDSFYDVSEGLANLTIVARNAEGAAFTTQTGPSGGYTLAAPPGVYTVTASGGSLPGPFVVSNVRHGLDGFSNTKVDFDTSTAPPPDAIAPTASATAADITQESAAPLMIVVTYSDNREVDTSTIDQNDLVVLGPGGFSAAAAVHAVTPVNGSNAQVRVEYRLSPRGGSWDAADDGVYSVRLQSGQVFDTSGNAAAGKQLPSFTVQIGELNLDWHNAADPADVNASGQATVADLLMVVSYLRENPPGPLPPSEGPPSPGYVDVNADGRATVNDLLAIVTHLRNVLAAEGEATHGAAVDEVFAEYADDEEWLAAESAKRLPCGPHAEREERTSRGA